MYCSERIFYSVICILSNLVCVKKIILKRAYEVYGIVTNNRLPRSTQPCMPKNRHVPSHRVRHSEEMKECQVYFHFPGGFGTSTTNETWVFGYGLDLALGHSGLIDVSQSQNFSPASDDVLERQLTRLLSIHGQSGMLKPVAMLLTTLVELVCAIDSLGQPACRGWLVMR